MKKKGRSLKMVFFGIVVLMVALIPVLARAEKPIKIGIIDVYSGAGAPFGNQILNGWKMAVDEFNERGGLKGRKIELIIRDDKFKPDEALSHARELVMKEQVDFLGGTASSGSSLAVSEFAKKNKKLFMVSGSRGHRITGEKGHEYVFRGCPSSEIEGLPGGIYAASKPFKKWIIIGEDYEYGHSIAENFWKGLTSNKKDAEKVEETWIKQGETDYSSYLTALMAKKPDAVFVAFGASGLFPFLKQAKLFNLFDEIPVFVSALGDSIFPKVLGKDMPVNVYGGMTYLWYYPATPANKAFVAKSKKLYDDSYPGGVMFGGYTSAKFLTEAILKARSVDTQKVIKALEGLTIKTVVGTTTMRACDHQAIFPSYWGKLENVSGFPFPVIKEVVTTQANKGMPTCKEIAELRKAAK